MVNPPSETPTPAAAPPTATAAPPANGTQHSPRSSLTSSTSSPCSTPTAPPLVNPSPSAQHQDGGGSHGGSPRASVALRTPRTLGHPSQQRSPRRLQAQSSASSSSSLTSDGPTPRVQQPRQPHPTTSTAPRTSQAAAASSQAATARSAEAAVTSAAAAAAVPAESVGGQSHRYCLRVGRRCPTGVLHGSTPVPHCPVPVPRVLSPRVREASETDLLLGQAHASLQGLLSDDGSEGDVEYVDISRVLRKGTRVISLAAGY
ncbi:MAG: hypothetical protein WDW38_007351 [Sanguina aurantia]